MSAASRYYENLNNPRQRGEGAHGWLMSTMNLGTLAGQTSDEMFTHVRSVLNSKVSDREIQDAIRKATNSHYVVRNTYAKPISNGQAIRTKLIQSSEISEDADLWENSPVRIDWKPSEDTVHFLELMFTPDELLFIGDREAPGIVGDNIRSAAEWIEYFRHGGQTAPHIIINPLSGEPAPTKSGDKQTYRGDACVMSFKYCLIEFDNLPREDQIRFWTSPAARKLPVACLVDSGGKSIHAWVKVAKLAAVTSAEQWQSEIKDTLYNQLLTPLGVDAQCSNASRLSRLPGHYRTDKKAYQRLLWLNV